MQVVGAFQALQHRAADMFTGLELTRFTVEATLFAIYLDIANAAEIVSLAKVGACNTLHPVSNEPVRLHGGIAATDAHEAGVKLQRARVAETAYCSASKHRERFARLAGT